ncbi:PREDICTED: chymotrypsin-2-like isoform X2 [Ceratosolen solmsi marchali]|nr:PREDICTED: chymotrypsin-2-like isoform X2 [Ceratosolen solmsi marchali]
MGGNNADIKEFPFLVSLTYIDDNKHTCGGAIISNYHILTAAHCLFNKHTDNDYLVIYSGSTSLKIRSGYEYRLKQIFIHPEFNGNKLKEMMNRHDIAIIEVEGFIEFNEYQQKARLPTENVYASTIATIAGWGLLDFPSIYYPEKLQKTSLKILDNSICRKKLPFNIHEDQLCAFEKIGVGVCVGDSGGPLILNGEVIGVISIGLPCGQGIPDVFTKVYSYLDFIRSIIGN